MPWTEMGATVINGAGITMMLRFEPLLPYPSTVTVRTPLVPGLASWSAKMTSLAASFWVMLTLAACCVQVRWNRKDAGLTDGGVQTWHWLDGEIADPSTRPS